MDVQEFWQENKRWVLGVVAGAIVFWIGRSVVDSMFGARDAEAKSSRAAIAITKEKRFDAAQRPKLQK